MPPTPALTRAGRARAVALAAPDQPDEPRASDRTVRWRATVAAGGLAVLLAGPLAAPMHALVAAPSSLVAVARTGGVR